MAGYMNNISAYQQMNTAWNYESARTAGTKTAEAMKSSKADAAAAASNVKTNSWKPIDLESQASLVPQLSEEYGYTIGNTELSDKAKEYYNTLKSKFGNAEFVLVSKDRKAQVQANASSYGNANKMVVLIDEEKLERMAEDESFRKKYEGIIAMAGQKLAEAKNSFSSSGAAVKNFGMSVNSDGKTEFFATLEKSAKEQSHRIEKKAAEKKAQKIAEKKIADRKAREERIEKAREKKDSGKTEETKEEVSEEKEYLEFRSDSMEDLLSQIQKTAYQAVLNRVQTSEEKMIGQNFDFKG